MCTPPETPPTRPLSRAAWPSQQPAGYWAAMSQENVETVQRAVEAWNADDLDAFLAELDADVEWHLRSSRALRERQLPTEVMTARERFGGRTAARRGNASRIGPRSSATSASRSSPSVTST